MRQAKKFKYRGTKSEILEPIMHEGFEIKSLKHGNTGHVLYKFPSKAHDWELCWTMDLQTAKAGVQKYQEHLKESNTSKSDTPVESKLS
jgi:hypothetical protein